jgi:hypothetical protein
MRQSNPFHFLHLACRWLLPWATTLAISASIARAASGMLVPALPNETVVRVASDVQFPPTPMETRSASETLPSDEAPGAIVHVRCPPDTYLPADVVVVSLQDLDLLMTSLCVVRPAESGL